MKRLFRAFGAAAVLTLIAAGVASAHHITDVYADCKQQTIVITYADFGKHDWPAFLDGPGEYEINDISSHKKNGSLTFPLFQGTSGGNGHYTFTWQHGFHGFDVSCEQPTPTPTPEPTPTPTPVVTPSPTPCADCVPTTFAPSFPPDQSTPPTHTPRPTLPPTDVVDVPQVASISWMSFIAGFMAGIATCIAVVLFARRRTR